MLLITCDQKHARVIIVKNIDRFFEYTFFEYILKKKYKQFLNIYKKEIVWIGTWNIFYDPCGKKYG